MSRELPIWNEAETDILPEFRLTFGHALIRGLARTEKVFESLGFAILKSQAFQGDELPKEKDGTLAFRRDDVDYAVVCGEGEATCIFADHALFLNSERWMSVSKQHAIALVTLQDRSDYFYSVFEKRKLIATAVRESGKLRLIGRSTAKVSQNGKVIASAEINPDPPEWIEQFLATDMHLLVTPGGSVKVVNVNDRDTPALLLTLSPWALPRTLSSDGKSPWNGNVKGRIHG